MPSYSLHDSYRTKMSSSVEYTGSVDATIQRFNNFGISFSAGVARLYYYGTGGTASFRNRYQSSPTTPFAVTANNVGPIAVSSTVPDVYPTSTVASFFSTYWMSSSEQVLFLQIEIFGSQCYYKATII